MIVQWVKEAVYRLRGEYTTEKLIRMGLKVGSNFKRLGGTILDPSHCWLIEIGNNVTLAPRVHILAHDASTKHWLGFTKVARVIVGNNVFIGADSVILPGVSVGDNCVVGAGSVVTRDVPANSVVAGNPAAFVCSLEDYLAKHRGRMKTRPVYGEEFTLRGYVTPEMKKSMKDSLADGPGYVD